MERYKNILGEPTYNSYWHTLYYWVQNTSIEVMLPRNYTFSKDGVTKMEKIFPNCLNEVGFYVTSNYTNNGLPLVCKNITDVIKFLNQKRILT